MHRVKKVSHRTVSMIRTGQGPGVSCKAHPIVDRCNYSILINLLRVIGHFVEVFDYNLGSYYVV
jgi:DNA-binding IclR family transcriptional regulator